MTTVGLLERLLQPRSANPRPRPDDVDILTESDGEIDAWAHGVAAHAADPGDTDVVTKSDGESDGWLHTGGLGPRPGPDTDTITRRGAETDRWEAPPAVLGPRPPRPDDTDILTFDDREADVWQSSH